MNHTEIEKVARKLQVAIWRQRKSLWPKSEPDAVDMLDPEIAAKILDIQYVREGELGRFGYRGDQFETAGMIDRRNKKIAVSLKFPLETIRFTGAHEIGHWLLHAGEEMHRDRPLKGLTREKIKHDPHEEEANYFAACFLMPQKLVVNKFEQTFDTKVPFVFDDTTAFWLNPRNPGSLLRPLEESMDQPLALASAESYCGRHFNSLSKQFRVSHQSMAIRIRELGLIQDDYWSD